MEEILREFGLRENEIKIYLLLLKFGVQNASTIASKSGLSRPYVYDALERLQEKSLVSVISVKDKKHFQAADPMYLQEIAQQRLENINSILPQMQTLQRMSNDEIKVELHKGTNGYRTLLHDIVATIKKNDEVLIFGIDDEELVGMGRHVEIALQQYLAKARRLKITERLIARKGMKPHPEAQTTKYKFLDPAIIGNTAFEVYGNKLAIFLKGNPDYLILITSQQVADTYRKQFEVLWGFAKER